MSEDRPPKYDATPDIIGAAGNALARGGVSGDPAGCLFGLIVIPILALLGCFTFRPQDDPTSAETNDDGRVPQE
jgi:hypothetical protein